MAAVVTIALGEYVDAGVIAAVLVFNAVVGFFQEYRAERSLEALRRLATTQARVMRDGRGREVDASELVPGDVVLIEAGAKVPADCRILHQTAFEADESLLTGESVPVAKTSDPVSADAQVAERRNMVFMGTVATRGRARAGLLPPVGRPSWAAWPGRCSRSRRPRRRCSGAWAGSRGWSVRGR